MDDIIYLEFNNWFSGRDYPKIPNIEEWVGGCEDGSPLFDDEWCKAQKICVVVGCIDMSINFCITATREWVEKNCPECLTDDTYTSETQCMQGDKQWIETEEYSFKQFRREPEDGSAYGRFGWKFLEYKEENFGRTWNNEYFEDEDEE